MNAIDPVKYTEKNFILKQFFFIVSVTIISFFIYGIIGARLSAYLYGIDFNSLLNADFEHLSREQINAQKFLQVFVTLGMFVTPALLMAYQLRLKPFAYLCLDKSPGVMVFPIVILLFVLIYPFLEWLIAFNENISLPPSMSGIENWIRGREDEAQKLTVAFMAMENLRTFAVNLLVLAIVPSVVEEIFFRGVIQRFMVSWLKNVHWAIILSAIFFSIVHLQFLGFFPRMVLGIFLGYLFYWTGSLWASVFAHFLNNAAAVTLVYLGQVGIINFKIDQPMQISNLITILGLALAAMVFLILAGYYSKKRNKNKDWVKVFSAPNTALAEILKGKLESNEIPAVVMNKRDSSYLTFGPVEVYVSPENETRALEIIEQEEAVSADE